MKLDMSQLSYLDIGESEPPYKLEFPFAPFGIVSRSGVKAFKWIPGCKLKVNATKRDIKKQHIIIFSILYFMTVVIVSPKDINSIPSYGPRMNG